MAMPGPHVVARPMVRWFFTIRYVQMMLSTTMAACAVLLSVPISEYTPTSCVKSSSEIRSAR